MADNVIQSLLEHAKHVNRIVTLDGPTALRFFVSYRQAGLPLHQRQIPLDGREQALFLKNHRLQRLRKAAHFFERVLRDLLGFAQLRQQSFLR